MGGIKQSVSHVHMAAECAHHGVREIVDGTGRRRWEATCGVCGFTASYFRNDVQHAKEILNHFLRVNWVLPRKATPYCSMKCAKAAREIDKEQTMSAKPNGGTPPPVVNPIIMRRVITLLNDQFDLQKRLYREGWSDERVAKDAETSVDFVVMQRRGAYGELAEDPMISKLRDEVAAVRELFAQEQVNMRQAFDAQVKEIDYKLARLVGTHKAAG